jgi:glycosyltransferase involved in cell wall biosynthesis
MEPVLSVVIPARDEHMAIAPVLRSLARQTLPCRLYEVIVVDDGSQPPLGAFRGFSPRGSNFELLRLESASGRAAARNAGARHAKGDVIVFLDGDTCASDTLLERHWKFHKEEPGPSVLMGRRLEVSWPSALSLLNGEDPAGTVADCEADLRDQYLAAGPAASHFDSAPWLFAYTHNISVDSATFRAVGGFDDGMTGYGFEDTELFYRIFRAFQCDGSGVFRLDRAALSYHLPHYRPVVAQRQERASNELYMKAKHRSYDMELVNIGRLAMTPSRIAMFRSSIATARQLGIGHADQIPAGLRSRIELAGGLVSAFSATSLYLPPNSITFDHLAPVTDTNFHLIGVSTQLPERSFDDAVFVDLWRFLLPTDLWLLIDETLRVSAALHLVYSRTPRASLSGARAGHFIDEVDFIERIVRENFLVSVADDAENSIITVRRR